MSCESKRPNDDIAFFIYQASRNSSSDAHELRYLSGRFYDSEELKKKILKFYLTGVSNASVLQKIMRLFSMFKWTAK